MLPCFWIWSLDSKTLSEIPVPPLSLDCIETSKLRARASKSRKGRGAVFTHVSGLHWPVLKATEMYDVSACWALVCVTSQLHAPPTSIPKQLKQMRFRGGETQDRNKILRYLLLRATQIGWMRSKSQSACAPGCAFKCVPVQPRAFNPDDRLQAFCCSLHQRQNVDSLVGRAAAHGVRLINKEDFLTHTHTHTCPLITKQEPDRNLSFMTRAGCRISQEVLQYSSILSVILSVTELFY